MCQSSLNIHIMQLSKQTTHISVILSHIILNLNINGKKYTIHIHHKVFLSMQMFYILTIAAKILVQTSAL